jgi:hypothetical protein
MITDEMVEEYVEKTADWYRKNIDSDLPPWPKGFTIEGCQEARVNGKVDLEIALEILASHIRNAALEEVKQALAPPKSELSGEYQRGFRRALLVAQDFIQALKTKVTP